MNNPNILLNISDFRAISEASIALNGMTVVSGINGCGKSTISKLLYYVFNVSCNFHEFALKNNTEVFYEYKDVLERLIDSIYNRRSLSERRNLRIDFSRRFRIPGNYIDFNREEIIQIIYSGIDVIYNYLKNSENTDGIINNRRLQLLIEDFYINQGKNINLNFESGLDIVNFLDFIKNEVKGLIYKLYDENETKPKRYMELELSSVFNSHLPSNIELLEFGESIYSNKKRNISKPFFIDNAVYIDTPMSFNSVSRSNPHWDDLNRQLKQDYLTGYSSHNEKYISNIISSEILQAQVDYQSDLLKGDKFIYKRELDNLELDLSDCATGIKSLSLILLLIKNGTINNKTILILDEPEAHLHPQWIVEYARVLVQLRKVIGCYIFISSHSTDMIQAIKAFSDKEDLSDKTLFYLAKKDKNYTDKFEYINLEFNISEIFKCFNKSLDKIEQYSN